MLQIEQIVQSFDKIIYDVAGIVLTVFLALEFFIYIRWFIINGNLGPLDNFLKTLCFSFLLCLMFFCGLNITLIVLCVPLILLIFTTFVISLKK